MSSKLQIWDKLHTYNFYFLVNRALITILLLFNFTKALVTSKITLHHTTFGQIFLFNNIQLIQLQI